MACALVVQEGSRLLENLLEVENRRRSWSLSQRGPGGRIVWSSAEEKAEDPLGKNRV